MFSVLIADDEVSICRLIKYLVPWEELGLELVDVVYNGFGAMDVIREKHVDILITDAKMPGCDGIELIKWCQENKTGIKCIVISGFRQFEYAHGAIRYGADAYLLKPIRQEDLIAALNKVIAGLLENQDYSRIHSQLESSKKNMKDYFMNTYLLEGEAADGREYSPEDDEHVIREKYMLHFYDGFYQMAYFKVSLPGEENLFPGEKVPQGERLPLKENQQLEDDVLQMLEGAVGNLLEQYGCEHIECAYKSGVYSFINYRQMKPEEFRKQVEHFYEVLEKRLEGFGNMTLTIGLSPVETSISALREKRFCAVEAAAYRLRHPYEKIFVYDPKNYPKLDVPQILTQEMKELAALYSNVQNMSGLKSVLFKCRTMVKKYEFYDPGDVCGIIRDFFDIVFSQRVIDIQTQLPGLKKELDFIVDHSLAETDLWKGAEALIDRIADVMEAARQYGQNKPVAAAKSYIDEHFSEPITLEDVAGAVHLNPRYLCRVFREQTGLTYSEYLTTRRMEYAALQLQKGQMSVVQIANAAGYQDVKYFTKLFKKQMGLRPSAYRRIYQ